MSGISDIEGVAKIGAKFVVSSPRKELLKKRFGLGAESSKPHSITISRSSNPEKKLMAIFKDNDGNKIKTTHFGQRGASDYTKHGEKERMKRYLERHGGGTTTSTKEDWKDPTTAGALSRWILWNKPSLSASFADYKRRFGLKGTMGVSKSAETFSAEKVKKEILEDDWQGLEMKFIYKDRIGKLGWSDNDEGKGGVLSFGDDPFTKSERMSRLPHTHTIDSATSKLAAKEMFRIMLDKPCESCGNAIHNKDIGACGWCEDDWDKKYKFDPKIDLQNDKWWKNLSDRLKDLYNDDLTTKNPYCRDCLYYYGGLGDNYPNKFDRESANYWLGNAVCETHWAEIVADGGLSKDTKRYSLYEIENISPRERMMKKRFGFGAEVIRQKGLPKKITLNRDGWETLIQGKEVGDYFSYVLDDLWRAMDFTEYPFKRYDQFDEFGWNVYGNYMVLVWKCRPTHYSERNQEWIVENRFDGYYDGVIKLLGDGKYEILYENI